MGLIKESKVNKQTGLVKEVSWWDAAESSKLYNRHIINTFDIASNTARIENLENVATQNTITIYRAVNDTDITLTNEFQKVFMTEEIDENNMATNGTILFSELRFYRCVSLGEIKLSGAENDEILISKRYNLPNGENYERDDIFKIGENGLNVDTSLIGDLIKVVDSAEWDGLTDNQKLNGELRANGSVEYRYLLQNSTLEVLAKKSEPTEVDDGYVDVFNGNLTITSLYTNIDFSTITLEQYGFLRFTIENNNTGEQRTEVIEMTQPMNPSGNSGYVESSTHLADETITLIAYRNELNGNPPKVLTYLSPSQLAWKFVKVEYKAPATTYSSGTETLLSTSAIEITTKEIVSENTKLQVEQNTTNISQLEAQVETNKFRAYNNTTIFKQLLINTTDYETIESNGTLQDDTFYIAWNIE